MAGLLQPSGMETEVRLTKREILDALNENGCVHPRVEDNAFVQHFNNELVKFNFTMLGDPEAITPQQWEWCNDPPPELCSIN